MSAKQGYERGSGVAEANATTNTSTNASRQYPDPDNPLPPGPWDPIIRAAIEQAGRLYRSIDPRMLNSRPWEMGAIPQTLPHLSPVPVPWGYAPDPWRIHGLGYTELNPQPLPPAPPVGLILATTLAREIVSRAVHLQQSLDLARIGNATLQSDLPRGFILGFAKSFVESLNAQPRDPWGGFDPFDPDKPPRPNWMQAILVGCLLKSASVSETTHGDLRLALEEAGALLLEAGLEKLPGTVAKASSH